MKKKFLALVCAAVMVMGTGVTVLAAGDSSSAGAVAGSGTVTNDSASAGAVNNNSGSSSSGNFSVSGKQTITASTLEFFVEDTKVEGGTVTAVSTATVQEAISQATQLYGDDTFIATIVDINVPGATFPYNLTIKCSNVWAGQTVTVLHKVGNTWERLRPSSLVDNAVTVTVNSFSPFAVVIDTDPSPKTGGIALMVGGLAGLFATGTVLTRKKRQ